MRQAHRSTEPLRNLIPERKDPRPQLSIDIYVAQNSSSVREVVISTAMVTTIAGVAGISGSADGNAGQARFNDPDGITTDGKGLYVTDSGNRTVREIQ